MYFRGFHSVPGPAVHAMVIYYGGTRPILLSKDYSPGERGGIIKPRGKTVKVSMHHICFLTCHHGNLVRIISPDL